MLMGIGTLLYVAGVVVCAGSAGAAVEEGINDLLRAEHKKQIREDIDAAVVYASRQHEKVAVIVMGCDWTDVDVINK